MGSGWASHSECWWDGGEASPHIDWSLTNLGSVVIRGEKLVLVDIYWELMEIGIMANKWDCIFEKLEIL